MGGFDLNALTETELEARKRLLLLQAMERQRQRAKQLDEEEAARTEAPDPFAKAAKLADPAYYTDRYQVAPATSAEKAEQMLFTMLSSGGAQNTGALGTTVFDQLSSMLSAFDQTEPS